MSVRKIHFALTVALLLGALLAGASLGLAQVSTASVTGTILDGNGAVIPEARVVITNMSTGETRTVSSGADGRYTFSLLIPGTYQLSAEAGGFKKAVRSGLVLNAGRAVESDMALEIGAVVESVEVSATLIGLDTQSANQVTNLTESQVKNLPVNYRNPLALVYTTAGVKSMIGQIGTRSIADTFLDMDMGLFAMNGGREGSNNITIDGLNAKGGDWGQTFGTPQVDAVQEVQITRNTYDAEYGRVGNGVVNLVTRGGSADWHGTVFEFLRNDKLDANRWENNRAGRAIQPLRRNQFGGTVSGPVWKSKRLYVLFGMEKGLIRASPNDTVTVPSLLERSGDFSQSRNANGSLQTIYDPFTTKPNPAGSGFVRDPFPQNVVPQNRIDRVGFGVANVLLPKPNVPGVPITNANNFFGIGSHPRDTDRWDGRLDWARTEKHSMFIHVTRNYFKEVQPRIFKTGVEDQAVSPHGNDRGGQTYQITLSNTFVPSPRWVANWVIGGGGNLSYSRGVSVSDGIDLTAIGYPASFRNQFPIAGVGGWTLAEYLQTGGAGSSVGALRTNSTAVNITNERGSHSIKFGFAGEQYLQNSTPQNTMSASFDRGPTTGPIAVPASNVTGNTIASLLLGVGTGSSNPRPLAPAASYKALNWYVQDTWRTSRKLTLTLGLRYELQRPRTERYNRQNYFEYELTNPIAQQVGLPLRGGLVYSTPEDRFQTVPRYNNFAPRFSFAYKVTDKMVIRSGYGISYHRAITENGVNGNDGYNVTTPWLTNPGGVVPQFLLANPFPSGFLVPTGNSLGAASQLGLSPVAWRRDNPTPYIQSYSFDIQYEVGRGSTIEIGYTGNVGRKLAYGVPVNYNQLHPSYLSMGEALNDLVPNPFFGFITAGALSGPTVPRNQLLRPYPHFAAVNSASSEKGTSSSFNAMYAKFSHRFSAGLSLLTTYQWSKAIDNASEDQGWWVNDGRRDIYNASIDYSISAHDVPHDLVNTFIYELPVGKGKKFGSNMSSVPQAILGGWQVSGIVSFRSGTPLTLRAPNTLAAFGFAVQRPNITNFADLKLENRSPERWFNTGAVQAPGRFEIGAGPRFLPNVRIDYMRNADVSLIKNFAIRNDTMRGQLRIESYNMLNTPLFGIPPAGNQVTLGAGAFGTVNSTFITGSRNIQLGLKLNF